MAFKFFHFFAVLALLSMCGYAHAQASPNVAYEDNNVRFTIITPGAVRMEWSPTGKFINDKSFIAINRTYAPVAFKVKTSGKNLVITTAKMIIRYAKGSGKFTAANLSITAAKGMAPFAWKPGMKQQNNLKGTYRTLDEYNGNINDRTHEAMPIEDGLLATDGWTLIDDSHSYLFDNSDWQWVTNRPSTDGQDMYFLAYGHDYKAALRDFTTFAGKVPLPPRYAFGYWWSRYWSYSDNEIHSLVNNFHSYGIPLDVLVVDMDWHYTEPGKGGWTGYTWNRRLFPDPQGFLKYLKSNDLEITLNLHPADGVANYETNYPALAKYMGIDTAKVKVIPFEVSNKTFMNGWFKTILAPMEKDGVDFWWLDWQQWLNDKKFPNLSNTWWINYATFSNMERSRDTRPMLYHRWGGLGNHRYQIGFSGDAVISWKSLDFQPYFNSTASNVLYSYWSHDIGGHFHADTIIPEMYVRWMQFGALSPILRTHSSKSAGLNKEPWVFDNAHCAILRDIVLQRYQMAPYIYTMARRTFDDALPLCRPMYYDYPEAKEAFSFRNEYMFGDNVLVCPITKPAIDGKSVQSVWLPAGNDWYEWSTGTMLKGGQTVDRTFNLDEYPAYIKAGSILPFYDKVKNLRGNDDPVVVTVFPGDKGSFSMYEDNGNDKGYAQNFATTQLSSVKSGNTLTVTIGARKGSYPDMPASRNFSVKVVASAAPESVTVNGANADFTFDGNNLALVVNIPETSCAAEKVVKITYPADAPAVADGLIGDFRHISQTVLALKQRDAGIVLTEELGSMESTGRALSYHPEEFNRRISLFRTNFTNLPTVLKGQKLDDSAAKWFLRQVNLTK